MIYVLLGEGFEEVEAIAPVDVLRRCGAEVRTAGIGGLEVTGAHGITVRADCGVEDIDRAALDMIVIPGGLGGVASINGSRAALAAIENAWADGKYVAAICAGPTVLAGLHISDGRRVTSYPGTGSQMGTADYREDDVVVDGKLITSRGPGTALAFARKLAETVCGETTAKQVADGMLIK